jgi:hypothetical protein
LTKAEDGGIDGVGAWKPGESQFSPASQAAQNQQYLSGGFVKVQT